MMRKIWGYIVLVIFVALYLVSSVQTFTRNLTSLKTRTNTPFSSDRARYGDLYGMSYLSYFRKSYESPTVHPIKKDLNLNIDLYTICDSYIWSFPNNAKYYWGVDKMQMAKTNAKQTLKVRLNPDKINILLLEFSERNIIPLLQDTNYIKRILTNYLPKRTNEKRNSLLTIFKNAGSKLNDIIFNKNINTNLESNLWDYHFLTPIKEFKADLNFILFDKVDKNVYLASSKKQLFLDKTINSSKATSAFGYVSDKKIESIVKDLNAINSRATGLGFDKVYLTIVPNPVSILEPNFQGMRYNHLTERVQASPQLKISFIDLFKDYSKTKGVYYASDSHWNWNGAQIWLNKFNAELKKYSKDSLNILKP